MFHITTLDIWIFIIYIISVLFIGFLVGRRKKISTEGYFLAGRTIPWFAVGLSMVATSISTEQFIGAGAKSYEVGMAVMNWEWGVLPSFTLLILIFIPLYLRRKIFTIPEYLERRYGSLSRTIFSVITLLTYIVVNLAGVLYSGGYTFHKIFGFPLIPSIWLLAILTGVYTIYGGLRSVVWTDTLQALLLIGGGAFIVISGLSKIPGGVMAAVGTGTRAKLILPMSNPEFPWTAILVLVISTNVWYACANQFYIQRCIGAKNEWHARMGVVFAAFLGIILGFTVDFSGVVGYKLVSLGIIPEPAESNAIYPLLITQLVPAGVRGLIFAGLVAAIMSTLSSLINSIATLFSLDIYYKFIKPRASEKHLIRVGQVAGALLLTAATLWSPVVGKFPTIFDFFQQSWAVLAAPFAVIFVLGALWKKANNTAAISTIITGVLSIPIPFWLSMSYGFNFYNVVLFILVVLCIIMVAVSLLSHKPPKKKVDEAVWTTDMAKLPAQEAPSPYTWYKSILLWWSIAACITGMLYVIFW